jgi:hypothetical protein
MDEGRDPVSTFARLERPTKSCDAARRVDLAPRFQETAPWFDILPLKSQYLVLLTLPKSTSTRARRSTRQKRDGLG